MANNLVTVHEDCHQKFHQGKLKHTFKKPKQYKETVFMNILRLQIINHLDCDITYGSYTTLKRKELGLSKTHVNDTIAITNSIQMQEYDQSGRDHFITLEGGDFLRKYVKYKEITKQSRDFLGIDSLFKGFNSYKNYVYYKSDITVIRLYRTFLFQIELYKFVYLIHPFSDRSALYFP